MADVLTLPGAGTNGGVPAPYLQGQIIGPPTAMQGRIGIGMGRLTRRFADLASTEAGTNLSEAQLQQLIIAAAQAGGSAGQQVNYDFEGLVGPPGPPGQNIITYLPPINGIGQVGLSGDDGAAGADAFADIDIPIPYTETDDVYPDDVFNNNAPSAGYVGWDSHKVKFKGVEYTIAAHDGSACPDGSVVFWGTDYPNQLQASDTLADAGSAGHYLVGFNNGGTFEPSMFQKLITSGMLQAGLILASHISTTTLSAISADLGSITAGTIVLNLGGTNRLKISPSGIQGSTNSGSSYYDIITVTIDGARITAASVNTTQIANNATAYEDWDSTPGQQGQITSANDYAAMANFQAHHLPIEIQAATRVVNIHGANTDTIQATLYYTIGSGSPAVLAQQTKVLAAGEDFQFTLTGYLTSGNGTLDDTYLNLERTSGSGESYAYNTFLKRREWRGK